MSAKATFGLARGVMYKSKHGETLGTSEKKKGIIKLVQVNMSTNCLQKSFFLCVLQLKSSVSPFFLGALQISLTAGLLISVRTKGRTEGGCPGREVFLTFGDSKLERLEI